MYFINQNNTNIDDEFDEKKKIPIQNKKLLIIIGIIFLLIISIIIIFAIKKNNDNPHLNYFLSLEGESLITIYKDSEFIDPGYIAKDNLGNILTKDVQIEGYVDADKIGDYKLIYKFHNQEKTRYISVVEKPIGATLIYLLGDLTVYLDINEEYKEPGYIVIDSVDSTLTDKVVVNNNLDTTKKGTYYIVYSVTNSAGVTTQTKRTVIVTDSDISLSVSNDKYTNKDVEIKINISDNYFDYLLLPDGNKVNNKNYTYKVSSNGVYKFISYNKKGTKKESSIKIDNIDKEKPTGSCSGSYSNGLSLININASDNIGISRYVIDGNSYTSKSITLNKEVSKVSIIIYDKAGNTNTISCNLSNNNPKYDTPIMPKGNENIKYNISMNTIKVWIESVSNYYVSHIWVENPYRQLKTAVPNNFGYELLRPSTILTNTVNSHGFQDKVMIAVNGSGFVLKDTYDTNYYYANNSFNMTSVSPIVIVEGTVYRDISNGNIPSDKHITYGLKKDGYLGYYRYVSGNNDSRNKDTSQRIINDGVLNTFAFNPVLVENGRVVSYDTSPNIRQGFCQIDKNNFIFITNNDGNRDNGFSFKRLGEYMVSLGCVMGFNLDGGGSTTLLYKDNSQNIITLTGNKRNVADILYFHQ